MIPYNIETAFVVTGNGLLEFFQRPGTGLYIPNYQRPYSWDDENITQMMEDLCDGVRALQSSDDAVAFFGAVICLSDKNKSQVAPKDPKAVPPEVLLIIDGQQRLSTMALLAIQLHYKLHELALKLPSTQPFTDLKEEVKNVQLDLQNVFALDMRSGNPQLKPKIIRAQDDTWTFDGDDANAYHSDIARYLAAYIRTLGDPKLPSTEKGRVKNNVKEIATWLDWVCTAHVPDTHFDGRFPSGSELASARFQEYIWKYERPDLSALVIEKNTQKNNSSYRVSAIAQLLLLCNYLLHRCCFTQTKPSNEKWAFDMFQSLNATGTPLTALETFLPLVIREEEQAKQDYKTSPSAKSMERVYGLLEVTDNAEKNTLSNALLTSFALACNGEKLPNKFSEQRKWLNKTYEDRATLASKRDFIENLGDVAEFYEQCWLARYTTAGQVIVGTEGNVDSSMTAFLMRYMKDANFQIIASILSRFYEGVLSKEPAALAEFVSAVKATAAFFTLWRSTRSNSGLDDVFRTLLKDGWTDLGVTHEALSWHKSPIQPTADALKSYYRYVLSRETLADEAQWVPKAKQFLSYRNAKVVCRFLLFVAAHETDADPNSPGLMVGSTPGVNRMYDPLLWSASDFKEIEHIAPEKNPGGTSGWDQLLYPDEAIHQIGNLTLLPKQINISAGNKGPKTKLLYYQHLGLTLPQELDQLRVEADSSGIQLAATTVEMLKTSTHKHHMKPILQRLNVGPWDRTFVESRSTRILEITGKRLYDWLQ
jgi:uncharacterized protein with ParB-like and HNH nuclease domain